MAETLSSDMEDFELGQTSSIWKECPKCKRQCFDTCLSCESVTNTICDRCSRTIMIREKRLLCQQDDDYSKSLAADIAKVNSKTLTADTVKDFNFYEEEHLSTEQVRLVRVERFVKKPIRFHHSVGSPSLLTKPVNHKEMSDNGNRLYYNDLVEQVAENVPIVEINDSLDSDSVVSDHDQNEFVHDVPGSVTSKSKFRKEIINKLEEFRKSINFNDSEEETSHIRIRRNYAWKDFVAYFWKKRNMDKYKIPITFLGEAGVDTAGLKRDFFSVVFLFAKTETKIYLCFCFSFGP